MASQIAYEFDVDAGSYYFHPGCHAIWQAERDRMRANA